MSAPHAKAAADLASDNAELRFLDMEDTARQVGASAVRALGPDIKRKAVEPIVPLADAAARLHRGGGDPVEDEPQATDVMGLSETRLGSALVAQREEEALVACGFGPEPRRARRKRLLGRRDARERLVLDRDLLRRILRHIHTLSDDEGDWVADQHRAVVCEGRAPRHKHR